MRSWHFGLLILTPAVSESRTHPPWLRLLGLGSEELELDVLMGGMKLRAGVFD